MLTQSNRWCWYKVTSDLGTHVNWMPDSWGNLPSCSGYFETPFSRASITCDPGGKYQLTDNIDAIGS